LFGEWVPRHRAGDHILSEVPSFGVFCDKIPKIAISEPGYGGDQVGRWRLVHLICGRLPTGMVRNPVVIFVNKLDDIEQKSLTSVLVLAEKGVKDRIAVNRSNKAIYG
jgi:hypothetical protein